jgi:hypothetical protein
MDQTSQVPWPLSSFPGATPQESAGRLINAYSEPLGDGGPGLAIRRRSPGLTQFADTGFTGYRGSILVGSLVYVALNSKLVTVDINGNVTPLGTLPGTRRVTFAQNRVNPVPDIQVVDMDNGAFSATSGAAPVSYNGGGILPSPKCVCSVDSFFFWGVGDNRVFAAGPNSTALNALTFITANSKSNGTLQRVINHKGLLFVFCSTFTELYNNTANPFPTFPFTRFKVLDKGLLGVNAIAGWEEGFGNLMWVGEDFAVYRLNGLEPEKISPPDLDKLIKVVGAVTPENLEASCYVDRGRKVWALSCPSWTWEFNLNTEKWNERDSYTPSNTVSIFQRWRATGSLFAFGKWLVGDEQSTLLGFIDETNLTEYGQPQRFRLESGPVQDFPNRQRVARTDLDFITGVGIASGITPNIVAPSVEISWSDNGGVNWLTPVVRQLGVQANSKQRVSVMGCGQTQSIGRRWRVDVTDPVYAGLIGSTQSTSPRAN